MSEVKGKSEQVRIRDRNSFNVINQIVEEYNASNGWKLVKINSSIMNNLDVYLERSTAQGGNTDTQTPTTQTPKAKVVANDNKTQTKEEVVEADEPQKKPVSTKGKTTKK